MRKKKPVSEKFRLLDEIEHHITTLHKVKVESSEKFPLFSYRMDNLKEECEYLLQTNCELTYDRYSNVPGEVIILFVEIKTRKCHLKW